MKMQRRDFIKGMGFALGSAYLLRPSISWALTAPQLKLPDLLDANVIRAVTGLRPMRDAGLRIELEQRNDQVIVHNYGHGGSGFTLSWGSADEAVALITGVDFTKGGRNVAVLGAGVVGLTTAATLAARGYTVTVYSREMSPRTTSDVAGAQWSPSFVSKGSNPAEVARFNRMLKKTYDSFGRLQGERYGVYLRQNIIPDGCKDGLQTMVPAGILSPSTRMPNIDFNGGRRLPMGATVINAWQIEPPKFMPALINDLRERGVQFVKRGFNSLDEVANLNERLIFNCTGLGARTLFSDASVYAMKGQLVHLKNSSGLNYNMLHRGYLFGRSDLMVLGGSYERNNYDLSVDPKVTSHILDLNRQFFRA